MAITRDLVERVLRDYAEAEHQEEKGIDTSWKRLNDDILAAAGHVLNQFFHEFVAAATVTIAEKIKEDGSNPLVIGEAVMFTTFGCGIILGYKMRIAEQEVSDLEGLHDASY